MSFKTMQEVAVWVAEHSETELSQSIAAGTITDQRSVRLALLYLTDTEKREQAIIQKRAIDEAVASAASAQRSAFWTMVAALGTAAAAFIMLAQALGWFK